MVEPEAKRERVRIFRFCHFSYIILDILYCVYVVKVFVSSLPGYMIATGLRGYRRGPSRHYRKKGRKLFVEVSMYFDQMPTY